MKNKFLKKEKAEIKNNSGFTLLEMLTVIAIFGIITSIVVSGYGKYTNDTVLTNMAYELALSVREAQIYGIAVSNRSSVSNFDNKFGINFYVPSGSGGVNVYHLFEDLDNDNEYDNVASGGCSGSILDPVSGAPTGDACQQEYVLQRNVLIDELYVNCSLLTSNQSLNIVFDRPNPEPIVNGTRGQSAQIRLVSSEGTNRYVHVSSNGQIFVDNELCS